MNALFCLIVTLLNLYWWVILVYVIMDMLIKFNVINLYNHVVSVIYTTLSRLSEPVLRPLRAILPDLGGIDLSPLLVLIGLTVLVIFIASDIAPMLGVTRICAVPA